MKVTVTLPHHTYDVTIEKGALRNIGEWVSSLWAPQRIMIITDETVRDLYGHQVLKDVRSAGFDGEMVAVKPGEPSKSLENASLLYEALAAKGLTRKDGIIALGGGVVGDLAGFVASTYMRGLHFLQVPTTLLAQVDSSIGGKTAVNTQAAKNLVGTFAQPDGVLIDVITLETLEPRRVREGIAEIVKSAAIADNELWKKLASYKNEQELLAHGEEVIAHCCEIKRKVVEQDEKDNGNRLLLNFGHTIGHALENTAGYGVVTHGEAVSIGMVQISRGAERIGTMSPGIAKKLQQMLEKFGLPIFYKPWQEEKLYQALTHDKKVGSKGLQIILLETIGQGKIVPIEMSEMRAYIQKEEEIK